MCLEDIHTSREPSQITPCHHLIHKSCFVELTVTHNKLVCPICNKSLYHKEEIQPLWDYYDREIELMPMTYPYEVNNHYYFNILMRDIIFDNIFFSPYLTKLIDL